MIRAGTISEILPSSGDWLILDIGFANKSASCGLLINKEKPVELRFNEAVEKICAFITDSTRPVNIVIEAPLSVAFDRHGNPTGRAVEKQGSKSNHARDVELLREVVDDCSAYPGAVVGAEALRMTETDTLKSAFLVAGIDTGVAPIIIRNG